MLLCRFLYNCSRCLWANFLSIFLTCAVSTSQGEQGWGAHEMIQWIRSSLRNSGSGMIQWIQSSNHGTWLRAIREHFKSISSATTYKPIKFKASSTLKVNLIRLKVAPRTLRRAVLWCRGLQFAVTSLESHFTTSRFECGESYRESRRARLPRTIVETKQFSTLRIDPL